MVVDAVRDTAWTTVTLPDGTTKRKMTPEGLYGRRKMTAHIRRTRLASASVYVQLFLSRMCTRN